MKQAVLTESGFEFRDVDVPECAPGHLLVKTEAMGVCEGEVFGYKSHKEGEAWMGHEASGSVVEAAADGFAAGDRVTVNGGQFAEFAATPASHVVKLPDEVSTTLALGEPVACCVHAAWRFGIRLGDRVAVVGSGFMGLMCLQLARLQGAAHVAAFDLIPWRLAFAEQLGADATHDVSGKSPQDVLEELGEFDVVIEAAGSQSAIDLATALVRMHGRMVLVGYHISNGGMRDVDMKTWNFKAIDVIHGHVRDDREKRDAMAAGVALIASGRLRVEPLVTTYPFADIGRAFQDLTDRKEGLFKAVLVT